MLTETKYRKPAIYKIYSEHDPDKLYIGQTINYDVRYKRHINDFKAGRHGNKILQRLYNKYDDLIIEIIEYCEKDELNNLEIAWIKHYKSYDRCFGYNMTKGGRDIPNELLIWDDERRKKHSEYCSLNPIAKGTKKSERWKALIRKIWADKKEAGIKIGIHNNKKCIVEDINTNQKTECSNLLEVANKFKLGYTYLTEKLKLNNGVTQIKNYKLELI